MPLFHPIFPESRKLFWREFALAVVLTAISLGFSAWVLIQEGVV